jgi:hypothetical protein
MRLQSRPRCRPKQLLADMHRSQEVWCLCVHVGSRPWFRAALGVVDKDHSGMAKVRTAVHDFSQPIGTSTNLGISTEQCCLPTVRDAFNLLRPSGFKLRLITSAYRSVSIHPDPIGHTNVKSGMGPHLQICPCLSVCARPSRFLAGSLRPLSENSSQRGSLPRLGTDDLWVSAETEEDCLRAYERLIDGAAARPRICGKPS